MKYQHWRFFISSSYLWNRISIGHVSSHISMSSSCYFYNSNIYMTKKINDLFSRVWNHICVVSKQFFPVSFSTSWYLSVMGSSTESNCNSITHAEVTVNANRGLPTRVWGKCYGEKDNQARVILYILQCGPITQLIFLNFSTIDIPNSLVWARNGMPLVSWKYDLCWCHTVSGIILYMCQANERWCYSGLWCKKTEQYQIAGDSPVTGEFPAQRVSNAENVSIWWCLHEYVKRISHS